MGVEAVSEDALVLHGFATPDMPLHKGLSVVDVPTGEVLWERPELSFEALGEGTITGSLGSYGQKQYTVMDKRSGRVVEEWGEGNSPGGSEAASGAGHTTALFPVTTMDEAAGIPASVQSFLSARQISPPVSWIEARGATVLSVHEAGSQAVNEQVLFVLKSGGVEEVFSDVIATELFVPDSFLIQEEMLYYVRKRKDLVAVNLDQVTRG